MLPRRVDILLVTWVWCLFLGYPNGHISQCRLVESLSMKHGFDEMSQRRLVDAQ